MVFSYVLINTNPDKEHIVYNKLLKSSKIKEIHPLFGEYDFIVKINVKNLKKLATIVLDNIMKTEGVIDVKTLTGTNM